MEFEDDLRTISLSVSKWTLGEELVLRRFLPDAEDVETQTHQMFVIENQPAIEEKRWLLHGAVDQFVVEFLDNDIGRGERR